MSERRVFLGIRPDETVRKALLSLARSRVATGARLHALDDLHLTLVFIGLVGEEGLERLQDIVGHVPGRSFDLCLDRIEYWVRPRVLCAIPASPPAALLGLQTALSTRLRAAGFDIETRPYRPHVTLARKAKPVEVEELNHPLCWRARRFLLYDSVADGQLPRYRPVADFLLADS